MSEEEKLIQDWFNPKPKPEEFEGPSIIFYSEERLESFKCVIKYEQGYISYGEGWACWFDYV